MSSWIVNDLTINRILSFLGDWDFGHNTKLRKSFWDIIEKPKAKGWEYDTDKWLSAIGLKIKELNAEAVNQRYNEDNGKQEFTFIYSPCKIEQAYIHLRCLTYQMNEGNVPETNLYKLLEEIEKEMAIKIAWEVTEKMNLEWEAQEIEDSEIKPLNQ